MTPLTLGETDAIERMAGQAVTDLNEPRAPKGKLIACIVVVLKHRTDPAFTLADAFAMPAEEAGELVSSVLGGHTEDPLD